jgi:hypothetical protein
VGAGIGWVATILAGAHCGGGAPAEADAAPICRDAGAAQPGGTEWWFACEGTGATDNSVTSRVHGGREACYDLRSFAGWDALDWQATEGESVEVEARVADTPDDVCAARWTLVATSPHDDAAAPVPMPSNPDGSVPLYVQVRLRSRSGASPGNNPIFVAVAALCSQQPCP